MVEKKHGFQIFAHVIMIFIAFCSVAPFILLLSSSFTDDAALSVYGYSFFPPKFSTDAYDYLFTSSSAIFNAYGISAIVTVCGTICNLTLTTLYAYPLSRKDLPGRYFFAFFLFFTMLFSGGLVPWYILIAKYLNLRNNPLSMLIPGLVSVFNILIMRNFLKSIPDSLVESAKIDGANDFIIYLRIILPLSGPSLATVGLFIALNYWNEWYNAMLFMTKADYFPLQYYLYRTLNSMNFAAQAAAEAGVEVPIMPTQSFKLVMTVAATGPIIFLYPFVQRYFIKGITVGAVKG